MSYSTTTEALNERVKELTCLYEISNIAADNSLSLEYQLQSIVHYLPNAWRHPEHGMAELSIDTKKFFSNSLPTNVVSQKALVEVENKERGYLAMHYDATIHRQSTFLREELTLLKTLAIEIGRIIARSEQQKREELLHRKIQHNDRLAILGEITAGIAHELNTPLGNILGFSQLIQDRANDEQIKHDIEKIISSAMHSREVVKKLMFFSCEIPQKMSLVAITPLIEEALLLLKISLKNAGIKAKFINSQGEINARVDPIQFTQVVFNLLINAIHASEHGQEITIKLASNATYLTLSIEDQGQGVSDDIKQKIFEPFFTTKSTGEGSGLGLSVVHGIVKSHGGSISVDSKKNRGAIFNINIPLNQKNV